MSILAAIAMMGSGAEATLPAPTVSFVSATSNSITVRVSHPYTTDVTGGDLTSSVFVDKDGWGAFWLTANPSAPNSGTSTTDVVLTPLSSGTEYSVSGRVVYANAQLPASPRLVYSDPSDTVLMSTT